jgi:hypothetical protein
MLKKEHNAFNRTDKGVFPITYRLLEQAINQAAAELKVMEQWNTVKRKFFSRNPRPNKYRFDLEDACSPRDAVDTPPPTLQLPSALPALSASGRVVWSGDCGTPAAPPPAAASSSPAVTAVTVKPGRPPVAPLVTDSLPSVSSDPATGNPVPPSTRTFVCKFEGCNMKFQSQDKLTLHMKHSRVHELLAKVR